MTDEFVDQFITEHYGKMTYLEMRVELKKMGFDVGQDARISKRVRSLKRFGLLPPDRLDVPRGEAFKRNKAITGRNWRINAVTLSQRVPDENNQARS